jgi:hypothetical protein
MTIATLLARASIASGEDEGRLAGRCRPRNESREKIVKCQHCPESQPLPPIVSVKGRSPTPISARQDSSRRVWGGLGRNAYA